MAVQNRNILKGWFVTLAKPVQSQFWDWIDSFRHVNEKIGSDDLEEELLQTITSLPDDAAIQQVLTQLNSFQGQLDQISASLAAVEIPLAADGTYTIPAGRLMHKIVVIAGNDADAGFAAGYSADSDLLVAATVISAGAASVFAVDHYRPADTQIYFHGITAPLTVKIYLL